MKKISFIGIISVLFVLFIPLAFGKTIKVGETTNITVTCSDNDGNLQTCSVTSPCSKSCSASGSSATCSCSYTGTTLGTYNMCGKAVDTKGSTDTACPSTLEVVDNTPPSVSITHSPSYVTDTDQVTYTATASDSESGINEIKIYVDNNLKKTCSSSPCEYTGGPYQNHSVHMYYAKAEDTKGNVGKSKVKSFSVGYPEWCPDPPIIISFQINNDDTYTNSRDVTLQTNASRTDECRFRNYNDSWVSWTSSYSSYLWTLTSGDGNKTVKTECRETTCDQRLSVSDDIILDETGPTDTNSSIKVNHTPRVVTQTDQVTYTVIAEDETSRIDNIKIWVDGNLEKTCSSSPCKYVGGPYSQGSTHTYYAKVWDNAGNEARDPLSGEKSFTVGCTGADCIDISVSQDIFYTGTNEIITVDVILESTSINNELIELYVEDWDGDYWFDLNSCTHCGCSGCGHSGPSGHEKREIKLKVPSGETSNLNLKLNIPPRKSPGRYTFKVKTRAG